MNAQDVRSKLTSHTFRSLCGFYYQSLCLDSNRSFDTLWSFLPLPILAQAVLQAHLEGLLHVFTTTSLPWSKELAEKLVARAAKDLTSSAAHALPGVLTVILWVCTCASVFVCVSWPFNMQASAHKPWHLTSTSTRKVGNKVGNNVGNVSWPFEERHDMN